MIVYRVIPLEIGKKYEIFSFRSLSLQWLHTFNSNLKCGYITGLQVKFEFVHGLMNFNRVILLGGKFSVPVFYLLLD
jgi:hypothetical protein